MGKARGSCGSPTSNGGEVRDKAGSLLPHSSRHRFTRKAPQPSRDGRPSCSSKLPVSDSPQCSTSTPSENTLAQVLTRLVGAAAPLHPSSGPFITPTSYPYA